jgi:hypothetical protein
MTYEEAEKQFKKFKMPYQFLGLSGVEIFDIRETLEDLPEDLTFNAVSTVRS